MKLSTRLQPLMTRTRTTAHGHKVKLARDGKSIYCSCPGWKFQRVAPALRVCKHLEAVHDSLIRKAVR